MTLADYEELVLLIQEARDLGLTIEEVREFLGIQETQNEQLKEGII
jgi:DNA-binding transcriptional MerR regulator